MAGVPQKLSKSQEQQVKGLIKKELLVYISIFMFVLTGVTGYGLWQVYINIKNHVENIVAKQFEEPDIQKVVRKAAAERASTLLIEQVNPEVVKFKTEIDLQLKELQSLVDKTRKLEELSRNHEQTIQVVLNTINNLLEQSKGVSLKLTNVRSEIVEMQKCIATVQYYRMKGYNIFPNPYRDKELEALNKLIAIAIPDIAQRSKFIKELQSPPPNNNE